MSILLHGAPVAERLTLDLSRRSAALRHRGVIPTLAILRVGSSPGDLAYEKSAAARCARCGIEVRRLFWDSAAPLADAIRAVNADPSIHGCLLLRPLADRAAEAAAGQLLLPDKDVDGMTPGSLAGLLTGQSGFAPCTAQACLELLGRLRNKKIFLFGTAGFGGSEAYYQKILANVRTAIDASNTVVGEYMCQGRMPQAVRDRYVKMKEMPDAKPNLDALIENFDQALSHPDQEDLERLRRMITG